MSTPPEHFDGWRLDIHTPWEAYNRIYFSYKRSEIEHEKYLKRLYRSHFVVFAYSYIDAIVSDGLSENLKLSKSQIKRINGLRPKVDILHKKEKSVDLLKAYDEFWQDIDWIRNELVHPSRRDHLAAIELDKLDLGKRINLLNVFAIRHFQILGQEFPYWLTGWNFVNSMTSDDSDQGITFINNTQFKVFLQMCGWTDARYPLQPLEAIDPYLIGENMYRRVTEFLSRAEFDTQPLPDGIGFSLMPLWSRVWWDKQAMEELRAFRMSKSPFQS